jgi:hypothetical protein
VVGTGGFLSFATRLLGAVGNDTIIDCRGDGAGVRLTVVWVLTNCIN